jgi:hypothetical protein
MPQQLVQLHQAKSFLGDMANRYAQLSEALDELTSLDRADRYLKYLQRMRIWLRQANFFWKGDQLTFIRAVAGFYSDYGAVLRLLKQDNDRGKFKVNPKNQPTLN